MSLIVKDTGMDYEQPPTGTHKAVCCAIHDLGYVPGYQGVPTHKVCVIWEIEERMTKGERANLRHLVTQSYSATLNEKSNLTKMLVSWRGRPFTVEELAGFDLEKVIGVSCLLNLVETKRDNGKTWINVASVMPLPKGMEPMKAETPPDYMPNWVKKILQPEAPSDATLDGQEVPF